MGRGIAAVLAAGGLDVMVCDVRDEAARDSGSVRPARAAARAGRLGQVTGSAALPDAVLKAPTWS